MDQETSKIMVRTGMAGALFGLGCGLLQAFLSPKKVDYHKVFAHCTYQPEAFHHNEPLAENFRSLLPFRHFHAQHFDEALQATDKIISLSEETEKPVREHVVLIEQERDRQRSALQDFAYTCETQNKGFLKQMKKELKSIDRLSEGHIRFLKKQAERTEEKEALRHSRHMTVPQQEEPSFDFDPTLVPFQID